MRPLVCATCGGEWSISSPANHLYPAQMVHYCNQRRVTKYVESETEQKLAGYWTGVSRSNAVTPWS